MTKAVRSSNCVYLEGQIQEIINNLSGISLSNLREGYLDPKPIVQAVIALESLKKTVIDTVQ